MSDFKPNHEEDYFKLLDGLPIDPSISTAQQLALQRLKKQKIRKKRGIQLIVVAAILMITFLSSIRYSSNFAQAMYQVPIFKPLVEMVAFDKGMEDILANQYFEEINESQTLDGKTLTITGVVADESGMIISYKLQSDEDLAEIFGVIPEVLQNNEPIQAGVSSSWSAQEEGTFEIENTFEISAPQGMDYSSKDFELHASLRDRPDTVFEIPFTLKKEIKASEHYKIDKQVVVDGQRFTMNELVISPLRTEIVLSIHPNNTKRILDFGDIQIYDERQEQWGKIRNGTSGFGSLDDEKFSLMLESNYFRIPKSITVEFSDIEVIDKKDEIIEIDFEKKQVLTQAEGVIKELEIGDNYEIQYKVFPTNKHTHKTYFSEVTDANGEEFHFSNAWISDDDGFLLVGQRLDKELITTSTPLVNPVQLKLSRYEQYLSGVGVVEVDLK